MSGGRRRAHGGVPRATPAAGQAAAPATVSAVPGSALRGRPPAGAFGNLLLTEMKLAWRTPVGLIFDLGLPVLLLMIFACVPSFRSPNAELGGITMLSLYIPILNVFVVAIMALVGLAVALAGYRELGVLRRMSTTPAPPSWVLGAQLVINLGIALVALLIVNLGGLAMGVEGPKEVGGFVLAILLTAAALLAMGLWIAAVARTTQGANAIGQLLFYPMMFFAGLYFPRELMPDVLRHISDWTPLGAAVHALQSSTEGSFPGYHPLLVLVGYALIFGFFAVKQFKWE
jgi:ABC-2 type transport system permease protein